MKRDPVRATVLASKIIPNVSPDLAKQLNLEPDQKSLALLTTDCDDVGYTAVDEATKKADVKVVYAKSFYGGAANANTKLAGEFIGILAGPNPAEVKAGLQAERCTLYLGKRGRQHRILRTVHFPYRFLPVRGRWHSGRRSTGLPDRTAA